MINNDPVPTDGEFPGNSWTESATAHHCHHNHPSTLLFPPFLSHLSVISNHPFPCSSFSPNFLKWTYRYFCHRIPATKSIPQHLSPDIFFAMFNPWWSCCQFYGLPRNQLVPLHWLASLAFPSSSLRCVKSRIRPSRFCWTEANCINPLLFQK